MSLMLNRSLSIIAYLFVSIFVFLLFFVDARRTDKRRRKFGWKISHIAPALALQSSILKHNSIWIMEIEAVPTKMSNRTLTMNWKLYILCFWIHFMLASHFFLFSYFRTFKYQHLWNSLHSHLHLCTYVLCNNMHSPILLFDIPYIKAVIERSGTRKRRYAASPGYEFCSRCT